MRVIGLDKMYSYAFTVTPLVLYSVMLETRLRPQYR
jgi:hypothetical protein